MDNQAWHAAGSAAVAGRRGRESGSAWAGGAGGGGGAGGAGGVGRGAPTGEQARPGGRPGVAAAPAQWCWGQRRRWRLRGTAGRGGGGGGGGGASDGTVGGSGGLGGGVVGGDRRARSVIGSRSSNRWSPAVSVVADRRIHRGSQTESPARRAAAGAGPTCSAGPLPPTDAPGAGGGGGAGGSGGEGGQGGGGAGGASMAWSARRCRHGRAAYVDAARGGTVARAPPVARRTQRRERGANGVRATRWFGRAVLADSRVGTGRGRAAADRRSDGSTTVNGSDPRRRDDRTGRTAGVGGAGSQAGPTGDRRSHQPLTRSPIAGNAGGPVLGLLSPRSSAGRQSNVPSNAERRRFESCRGRKLSASVWVTSRTGSATGNVAQTW